MASPYNAALANATHPSVKTQWSDEQQNLPSVNARHIPILKTWLTTVDSPAASETTTWLTIKSNWISFLAATGKNPSTVLAPNRKRVQWGNGPESDAQAKKRFQHDQRERLSIQGAIWRLFDGKEALVERWPRETRLVINRVVESNCQSALVALMDDFGKQRRFNSVWSSMICFLLYCHDEEDGTLGKMGLQLSEDLQDDLLDITQALIYEDYPKPGDAGEVGLVEQELHSFIHNILTDSTSGPETNPLLWWTIVLVRSSVEDGPDDFISRGRFRSNILPMDLDIQQRLEGIVHFAKVFLLDLAFASWEPSPKAQLLEVQNDLNVVDNTWMGTYSSPRPTRRRDERTCDTPAWRSISAHLEKTFHQYMGEAGQTSMRHIIALRSELMGLEST
jgi:hypothetical protein